MAGITTLYDWRNRLTIGMVIMAKQRDIARDVQRRQPWAMRL
jgi:hypothetical protein